MAQHKIHKDVWRFIQDEAKARGWEVEIHNGTGLKFTRSHTDFRFAPRGASDYRGIRNLDAALRRLEEDSGYDYCRRHKQFFRNGSECRSCVDTRAPQPQPQRVLRVVGGSATISAPAPEPAPVPATVVRLPEKRSVSRRRFIDGVVPYADIVAIIELGMETRKWETRTALLRDAGFEAVSITTNWAKAGEVAFNHFEAIRRLVEDGVRSRRVPGSHFRVPIDAEAEAASRSSSRQPLPTDLLTRRIREFISSVSGAVSHSELYKVAGRNGGQNFREAIVQMLRNGELTSDLVETIPGHSARVYRLRAPFPTSPAAQPVAEPTEVVAVVPVPVEPPPARIEPTSVESSQFDGPAFEPAFDQPDYVYLVRALLAYAGDKPERQRISNRLVARVTRMMSEE